jgi:hypothetical protein
VLAVPGVQEAPPDRPDIHYKPLADKPEIARSLGAARCCAALRHQVKLVSLLLMFLTFIFVCYLVFLYNHDQGWVKPAKKPA